MIDGETAQALAEGYVAYMASGEDAVMEMFSSAFFDNVSGRSGLDIFQVVRVWMDQSFDQRSAELHLVTHTEDTVVIWYTVRGRHIGNGFPRLAGRPVKGNAITWPQVHIFRLSDGLVVEHWAVRDDATLLDAVDA
ncbi:MAG TPA: ester cyclase [Nocardioidaceae bacterium]|nr:ester cyclase [Nocardioidaceae bacterium]